MIITTSEVLERLERMSDNDLNAVIEPAFDSAESYLGTAPDRAIFTALLRALTDEYRYRPDVDTLEHIREAESR